MTYKQAKLCRNLWTCSYSIPLWMFQLYNELDYTLSQDLSCPVLGLVRMGLVPHGVWERYLGCPLWGPTPMGSSFLRLRGDKPGYYFPWIVLCPHGCHVQGKHLTCIHGRASILVLALWGKSMCWTGKLREFFREKCAPRSGPWACTLSHSQNSLLVPEPLTLTTFFMPQKSKFLSPI